MCLCVWAVVQGRVAFRLVESIMLYFTYLSELTKSRISAILAATAKAIEERSVKCPGGSARFTNLVPGFGGRAVRGERYARGAPS